MGERGSTLPDLLTHLEIAAYQQGSIPHKMNQPAWDQLAAKIETIRTEILARFPTPPASSSDEGSD